MDNKRKVIIIDDEVDFCLLVKFYLSKKNCDVCISHTLQGGLGLIKNNIPDIVILDNNLPDGLGWLAANNILEAAPGVHLFLISANKPTGKTGNNNDNSGNNNDNYYNKKVDVVEKPISISQIDTFLK